jgi:hypothetical protein
MGKIFLVLLLLIFGLVFWRVYGPGIVDKLSQKLTATIPFPKLITPTINK